MIFDNIIILSKIFNVPPFVNRAFHICLFWYTQGLCKTNFILLHICTLCDDDDNIEAMYVYSINNPDNYNDNYDNYIK